MEIRAIGLSARAEPNHPARRAPRGVAAPHRTISATVGRTAAPLRPTVHFSGASGHREGDTAAKPIARNGNPLPVVHSHTVVARAASNGAGDGAHHHWSIEEETAPRNGRAWLGRPVRATCRLRAPKHRRPGLGGDSTSHPQHNARMIRAKHHDAISIADASMHLKPFRRSLRESFLCHSTSPSTDSESAARGPRPISIKVYLAPSLPQRSPAYR